MQNETECKPSASTATDESFHDSKSGDVYDLYNACNGIVIDGILDIEQLNHYTPKEAEELNVPRLRQIWEHTKTGCLHCRDIIEALHVVRRVVADIGDDINANNNSEPDIDIDHSRSIS